MMRFLFKPSLSYAFGVSFVILLRLWDNGHWAAALVWLFVSSIVGGIIETIVMERAQSERTGA